MSTLTAAVVLTLSARAALVYIRKEAMERVVRTPLMPGDRGVAPNMDETLTGTSQRVRMNMQRKSVWKIEGHV